MKMHGTFINMAATGQVNQLPETSKRPIDAMAYHVCFPPLGHLNPL
jgi:hypothetical protein